MLDKFAVYAGRKNFFNVKITGNEYFHQLLDNSQKGFIVASLHVGNFEISGYLLAQNKKRINVLIFGGESREIMKNRKKVFETNNICAVPVDNDMSHIFTINEALQNSEIVSMPCDRSLGSDKALSCRFLNGEACFPHGAFVLAAIFDVPVLNYLCN